MQNLTANLKNLGIGQKLTISKEKYDVVIATKNRLKRNGFGTFTLKTEDSKIIVEKIS